MRHLESAPSHAPNATAPLLSIRLLGRFQVMVGTVEIEESAWRLRKAQSLVKLLALAPGQRLHREQVLEALWPNVDPESATNSLHQALHAARSALAIPASPPGWATSVFLFRRNVLALAPPCGFRVDIHDFEQAVTIAQEQHDAERFRAAAELYTGDLLPEDRYEDWASAPRDAFRSTYHRILRTWARVEESGGRVSHAIEVLQRLLASDPTDEGTYADLMRLYARLNQRHQALQLYVRLQLIMRREFEAEPEPTTQRLYQEILAGHGSPVPAAEAVFTNLPSLLTRFIGREREKRAVAELITTARLLTLIGPGGCGKTRLAIAVASEQALLTPDGAWLVQLAPLVDPAQVPQTIAAALGVREDPHRTLLTTLIDSLRAKKLLLVLDNCEHLVEACAAFVDTLLPQCPGVHVLGTSREALRVTGELTFQVPSLALPAAEPPTALAHLESCEAVALLLDRLRLRQPTFHLTLENSPAVVEICRRLDGIPLAIELAAARAPALSVEQIAVRLDDALRLLTSGSRTAVPRQQTLRATLEWSYQLLSTAETMVFSRLAVFAGGWTIEAAEAVCPGSGVETDEVLNLLAQLVEKSLVVGDDRAGAIRYRLLEIIRQYARERLYERQEEDATRLQHATYFLRLAEMAEPAFIGPHQGAWLDRIELEYDNLHSALRWSFDAGAAELTARLSTALLHFWERRGYVSAGRWWLERVLALAVSVPPALKARLAYSVGMLARIGGDSQRATETLQASLALYRELGDTHGCATVLGDLGMVALDAGAYDEGEALLREGLRLCRAEGNRHGAATILNNLGLIALGQSDGTGALALMRESLVLSRQLGDVAGVALTLTSLAWAGLAGFDDGSTAEYLQESLRLRRDLRDRVGMIDSIEGIAGIAAAHARPLDAARLFGAAESLRESVGFPMPPVEVPYYQLYLGVIHQQIDPAAFGQAWGAGRALTLDQAANQAYAIAHNVRG